MADSISPGTTGTQNNSYGGSTGLISPIDSFILSHNQATSPVGLDSHNGSNNMSINNNNNNSNSNNNPSWRSPGSHNSNTSVDPSAPYRYKYPVKTQTWYRSFFIALAWILLLAVGMFLVFAPYNLQSRVLRDPMYCSYYMLIGWILILVAAWGLSRTFRWCRRHRPLGSRWQRRYHGWKAWSHDSDNSHQSTSSIDGDADDDDDNTDNDGDNCFNICTLPRRFLPCRPDPSLMHRFYNPRSNVCCGGWTKNSWFWREVFKIDMMMFLYTAVVVLVSVWLIAIVHSSKACWYMSSSYYFEAIFLGILLFYFIFRFFMVRGYRFVYNVLWTSFLTVFFTHFRLLSSYRGFGFYFGFLLLHWFFLFVTATVLAIVIGLKKLYEF